MKIIESNAVLDVPPSVAACPICGAPIVVEDIAEWEAETGEIVSFSLECTTMPDIDSDDWPDWHRGHWSTPYADWLPLERPVLGWLSTHYRVRVGEGGDAP